MMGTCAKDNFSSRLNQRKNKNNWKKHCFSQTFTFCIAKMKGQYERIWIGLQTILSVLYAFVLYIVQYSGIQWFFVLYSGSLILHIGHCTLQWYCVLYSGTLFVKSVLVHYISILHGVFVTYRGSLSFLVVKNPNDFAGT